MLGAALHSQNSNIDEVRDWKVPNGVMHHSTVRRGLVLPIGSTGIVLLAKSRDLNVIQHLDHGMDIKTKCNLAGYLTVSITTVKGGANRMPSLVF